MPLCQILLCQVNKFVFCVLFLFYKELPNNWIKLLSKAAFQVQRNFVEARLSATVRGGTVYLLLGIGVRLG